MPEPVFVKKRGVAKVQAAQGVPSWTVWNEMRSVVCWKTVGAK